MTLEEKYKSFNARLETRRKAQAECNQISQSMLEHCPLKVGDVLVSNGKWGPKKFKADKIEMELVFDKPSFKASGFLLKNDGELGKHRGERYLYISYYLSELNNLQSNQPQEQVQ